jgi:uncharacterized protein DUF3750
MERFGLLRGLPSRFVHDRRPFALRLWRRDPKPSGKRRGWRQGGIAAMASRPISGWSYPVLAPHLALLKSAAIFLVLVFFPIGLSAGRYWLGESRSHWQTADRSSAGLLPLPSQHTEAIIRVYGARTVRWKAIFAIHTWIVVKEAGASTYTRYDYTAWGEPIRTNGFAADARWFGAVPETIAAIDGAEASLLIPKIRHVVENYRFRAYGDYNAWPGPNSNTFVQAVLDAVPELKTVLPPTAIGKDYPHDGRWLRRTPSGTGLAVSLGGYAGLTLGWVEGIEVNILGAVAGLDLRRPALKLPGLGRLGLPGMPAGTPAAAAS